MKTEKMQKAMDKFLANPHWKEVYEGAPEKVKKLYEITFVIANEGKKEEGDDKAIRALYGEFSGADWEYLIDKTQSPMGKWGYKKAKEKFGKSA